MKSRFFILFIFFLSACISSESAESNSINSLDFEKNNIQLLDSFNVSTAHNIQRFDINVKKQVTIIGQKGTLISFPQNCFGSNTQQINVELIECYSIQDMILNGLSTQTINGELLESGGMIFLKVFDNYGKEILVSSKNISVKVPTKKIKNDMKLFQGVIKGDKIVWELLSNSIKLTKKSDNSVIIQQVDDPEIDSIGLTFFINAMGDTIIVSNPEESRKNLKQQAPKNIENQYLANYVFNITKLGWINCDRFIEGETQNIFVSLNKGQETVSLYLVLDKLNSNVMPRYPKAVNGQFEFRNIPINESFTLVALASKGEEIYFGMSNYVNNGEVIQCPELKPITRQELFDKLLEKFGKDIWSRPLA